MSESNETDDLEVPANKESATTEIAYWFIPLPDPMEVPHGYVARFSDRPNMRRLVEGDSEEIESHFFDPFFANGVSLLFRQKEKPLADLWDFDLLLETVAEAFPDLPSRNQTSANEPIEPAPSPPSEHVTIVEIAALLDRDLAEEDRLSDAFDRSLEYVRRVQRAFYAITEKPIRLAARESLPPILPMGIRRISGEEDSWPKEIALWPINENVGNIARREDLGEQEISNLNLSIERDRAAFRAYVDFRREASVALSRDGDCRASVLATATAAEVLLDDLLMHLLWEEKLRPEDAAVIFTDPRAGLLVRLRAQYQSRLRGDWSPEGSGPVADWAKHIASVRHRAVHGGYRPTIEEGRGVRRIAPT